MGWSYFIFDVLKYLNHFMAVTYDLVISQRDRADHSAKMSTTLSRSSPESIKADNRANNWKATAIMVF